MLFWLAKPVWLDAVLTICEGAKKGVAEMDLAHWASIVPDDFHPVLLKLNAETRHVYLVHMLETFFSSNVNRLQKTCARMMSHV